LRAEIPMRHRALVSLEVGFPERRRSFDAHVLVGRKVGLDAEARAAGCPEKLGLA